jgi:hypothetical protein
MAAIDRVPLFNRLHAASFAKRLDRQSAIVPSAELRHAIYAARRFSADDTMSTFLADLADTAFAAKTDRARVRALEAIRTSARLPHRTCWFEISYRHTIERSKQLGIMATEHCNPPSCMGWLLEQHENIETAFQATVFVADDRGQLSALPWAYCWTSDYKPLPYDRLIPITAFKNPSLAAALTGIACYNSDHVNARLSPTFPAQWFSDNQLIGFFFEWIGMLRPIWALLATINDLPVAFSEISQSRGFYRASSYRKFLDFKLITLKVPQTEYRAVARNAVALIRRRAHQVRGHWRRNFRRPGERLWIREHLRGDASLGFVLHDYLVKQATSP